MVLHTTEIKQNMRLRICGLFNIRSLPSKAVLVNDLLYNHHIDVYFLTKTWLPQDECVSLNESSPPVILILIFPEALAEEVELQPFSTQAC